MQKLTMFYLESCGYCDKARRALKALGELDPKYAAVPLEMIEESEQPEIADRYDYYAVPSFFLGQEKLFEARLFMSYEEIYEGVRRSLERAMEAEA